MPDWQGVWVMLRIREYDHKDWSRICEVHDRARMQELQASALEAAFLPLEIAAHREGLFDYTVWVAEAAGVVCAFIAHDEQEIAWLYVHPDHHRKGMGKALVAKVTQAITQPLTIEVLQGNQVALQFYQACGFRLLATESGVMPGNEKFSVTVHELKN